MVTKSRDESFFDFLPILGLHYFN